MQKPSEKTIIRALGWNTRVPKPSSERLESVHEISTEPGEPVISQATLMALGFIGRPDSATRRQKVADFLKIGHTNGKQFAKRLQLFGITEEQLRAAPRGLS